MHSTPSQAVHTRSPVPVTAPGPAAKVILTSSASRRASLGAAWSARAHCSPASPRRKCRRPRRAPASRPGRPPTPATAIAAAGAAAAAAAGAEGEARGAGPRALPDPAAPSCLERAAKPGRERCRGAGERAGGRGLRSALGSAPDHRRPAPVGSAAAALSRHVQPGPLRSALRGTPPPRPSGPSPARGELRGVLR